MANEPSVSFSTGNGFIAQPFERLEAVVWDASDLNDPQTDPYKGKVYLWENDAWVCKGPFSRATVGDYDFYTNEFYGDTDPAVMYVSMAAIQKYSAKAATAWQALGIAAKENPHGASAEDLEPYMAPGANHG